jgi:flagellar FliL protein
VAKQDDTQSSSAPNKAGGKKGLLVGAAIAVVALAIGVGGAWFFLGHKGGGDEHAPSKPKRSATAPIFVTLEPFVVNLAGDVQHFLQVGIDLRVADNSVSDQIKVHLPEIRNGVLLLLSSKKVEDLTDIEQKNRLRAELREVVNKPLGIYTPPPKAAAAVAAGGEAPQPVGEAHATEQPKPAEADPAQDSGVLEVLLTSFVIQ